MAPLWPHPLAVDREQQPSVAPLPIPAVFREMKACQPRSTQGWFSGGCERRKGRFVVGLMDDERAIRSDNPNVLIQPVRAVTGIGYQDIEVIRRCLAQILFLTRYNDLHPRLPELVGNIGFHPRSVVPVVHGRQMPDLVIL